MAEHFHEGVLFSGRPTVQPNAGRLAGRLHIYGVGLLLALRLESTLVEKWRCIVVHSRSVKSQPHQHVPL